VTTVGQNGHKKKGAVRTRESASSFHSNAEKRAEVSTVLQQPAHFGRYATLFSEAERRDFTPDELHEREKKGSLIHTRQQNNTKEWRERAQISGCQQQHTAAADVGGSAATGSAGGSTGGQGKQRKKSNDNNNENERNKEECTAPRWTVRKEGKTQKVAKKREGSTHRGTDKRTNKLTNKQQAEGGTMRTHRGHCADEYNN
jgi:hypothetical protein